MEKPQLIGYVGVIGSGKDYNCKLLEKEGYLHVNFADSLREFTWNILGWKPSSDADYENFKKQTLKLDFPVTDPSGVVHFEQHYLTGRELLQRLGELSRQTFGEDCWIQAYLNRIRSYIKEGHTKFCTSDVRYPNELRAVMFSDLLESKVYFTNYISTKYNSSDTHASERMAQKFLKNCFRNLELITPSSMTTILGD